MAGKMPPGYGQQPPPYQQNPQNTTVVLQGAPQTTYVQRPARGLFGSLIHEANKAGDQLVHEINRAVEPTSSPALSLFVTGNVVQLISRSTGRALQILMGAGGQLVLDGNGPPGPGTFNSGWTVVNEGYNQVRLHNNNNYLTIVNGHTTLINMPVGAMHGVETKWQLSVVQNFVVLESLKERGRHVGVLPTGQLKPALACGRDLHAHFGVQLLSSPYPPQGACGQVTVVKH